MAYTDIDDPTAYFQSNLHTGNSGTNAITFSGNSDLQPDWIWIKERGATGSHVLTDIVRGITKQLYSNDTQAENTNSSSVTAIGSNGFTLGNRADVNNNSDTYVSWNWKAGGAASSNTDGTQTSSVSVNQDAGFSIVTYTGGNTNDSSDNVGHGLGVIPSMIITKVRNGTTGWIVGHKDIGWNDQLVLNTTAAESVNNRSYGVNTNPTSSVFTVAQNGGDYITNSGGTFVSYCFAEKQGYSKFGSYTGNGNADGTFVYTGFKPAFVMAKRSDSASAGNWNIRDSKRSPSNVASQVLQADSSAAEGTATGTLIDMYSNGFKPRNGGSGVNAGSSLYIYMAFAENPFVTSTGVPATAR